MVYHIALLIFNNNIPYSHQISSIPDKPEKCGDKVKILPFPHPQKHFPQISKRVEVILEKLLDNLVRFPNGNVGKI